MKTDARLLHLKIVSFIRSIYGEGVIPLHRPVLGTLEKQHLSACIDSNYVSSMGYQIAEFEQLIACFTGVKYAVATVNGTSALHVALKLAGAHRGCEVLTQPLTFVATANAISYCGAHPVFIDVDRDTLGMSPTALQAWLYENAERRSGLVFNKTTGCQIAACVPMHTFGFACRIREISKICVEWGIALVEDAAESLGSYVGKKHTGTFGSLGILSFNGNKIITTGGGGMIMTDNENLAKKARHITTTAKIAHPYEFVHDEIGYNYRLPSINAVLGCAQMKRLNWILDVKKQVANLYLDFFNSLGVLMIQTLSQSKANNWLNAIVLTDKRERDEFLNYTNDNGLMTRPIWRLTSELEMFKDCQNDGLTNARWLEERVVNLPSSVPDRFIRP
jgi:perosamine synthetase